MKLSVRKIWKAETSVLIFFIILFAVTFTAFGWQKLVADLYNGLDLAIFNTSLYNLLHSALPLNSIHPSSYFSDHLSPLLYLLVPFYSLWPGPYLLITLQVFIIALCAWPLFLLVKKKSNTTWGLVVGLVWLFNPWVQWWSLYEFSLLPFLIFFIFWLLRAYENKNLWHYYLWLILIMLVREEAAIIIAPILFIILWQKRDIKKWFIPTALIIMISLVTSYYLLWSTAHYKFLTTFNNALPTDVSSLIIFLTLLFIPLGFLFYQRPLYLLFLPAPLLVLFLNKSGLTIITLKSHYVALLLWPLCTALNEEPRNFLQRIHIPPAILLLSLSLGAMIFWGPLFHWSATTPQPNPALVIADASPVAASYSLLTRLSTRNHIQSLGYAYWGKGQYNLTSYALDPQTEYLAVNWQDLLMARAIWQENYNHSRYDAGLTDNVRTIMKNFEPFAQAGSATYFKRGGNEAWTPNQTTTKKNELGFNSIEYTSYTTLPALRVIATVPSSTNPYILRIKINDSEQILELGNGFILPTSTTQTISQTILLNPDDRYSINIDLLPWTTPRFTLDNHNSAHLDWSSQRILYSTSTVLDTDANAR